MYALRQTPLPTQDTAITVESDSPRRFILPGMGADASMYQGLWRELPHAHFCDWPAYAGQTSIADVAESLIDQYRITSDDELIGTSFGGMVSAEITIRLNLRRVFLIDGALSPG